MAISTPAHTRTFDNFKTTKKALQKKKERNVRYAMYFILKKKDV